MKGLAIFRRLAACVALLAAPACGQSTAPGLHAPAARQYHPAPAAAAGARAAAESRSTSPLASPGAVATTPAAYWAHQQRSPQFSASTVPISTSQLTLETIQHSFQLQVDAGNPRIERTRIVEAEAEFDWNAFLEGRWRDLSEPVGSSLTTGSSQRFRNERFETERGLRQRNTWGGELSVAQQFSFEASNSQFFQPPRQGGAQLTLTYEQPLLRGAGQLVNRSTVVLAQLGSERADQQFLARVQDRLVEATEAYWRLYVARGDLVLQRRLVDQAERVAQQLRARENVDGARDSILRSEGAAAMRRAQLERARREVIDIQAELRNLVNSPRLAEPEQSEFLPLDDPPIAPSSLSRADVFATAMANRPETAATLREIRSATLRREVAENELLPDLRLVLETYARGLRGDNDAVGAWSDQFSQGKPSLDVGLEWSAPIGRRAAQARTRRTRVETVQAQLRLRVLAERIVLETGQALRQVETAHREMLSRSEALQHFSAELRYLEQRRQLTPSVGPNGSIVLQDLLNAQVRLTNAELAYLQSRADYAVGFVRLHRAMGTLLQCAPY